MFRSRKWKIKKTDARETREFHISIIKLPMHALSKQNCPQLPVSWCSIFGKQNQVGPFFARRWMKVFPFEIYVSQIRINESRKKRAILNENRGAIGGWKEKQRRWLKMMVPLGFISTERGKRREPLFSWPCGWPEDSIASLECICINSVLSLFKCSRIEFVILSGTFCRKKFHAQRPNQAMEIRGWIDFCEL